ncbi:MAG: hypothetical protein O9256_00100 [Rhizobiaceae bacterium]|nr:hypothetical protein [Rhizobiaceae bacterium]MCZ8351181.1 hypothetical protein [Rhizobium sp.]
MTHDDYVAYIRERFSDLFNPSNADEDWRYLITINQGWWPLLTDFCEQLEGVLKHHGETRKWYVRQVKEKFGELRIYVRPAPYERPDVDGFMEWVDDIDPPEPTPVAEMIGIIKEQVIGRAAHICEECGERGEMRVVEGWYGVCCVTNITASG